MKHASNTLLASAGQAAVYCEVMDQLDKEVLLAAWRDTWPSAGWVPPGLQELKRTGRRPKRSSVLSAGPSRCAADSNRNGTPVGCNGRGGAAESAWIWRSLSNEARSRGRASLATAGARSRVGRRLRFARDKVIT